MTNLKEINTLTKRMEKREALSYLECEILELQRVVNVLSQALGYCIEYGYYVAPGYREVTARKYTKDEIKKIKAGTYND